MTPFDLDAFREAVGDVAEGTIRLALWGGGLNRVGGVYAALATAAQAATNAANRRSLESGLPVSAGFAVACHDGKLAVYRVCRRSGERFVACREPLVFFTLADAAPLGRRQRVSPLGR